MRISLFYKSILIALNSFNGNYVDLNKLSNKIVYDLNKDIYIQNYSPTIKTEFRVKTRESMIEKVINRQIIPLDRLGLRIIYKSNYCNDEFLSYYIMKNLEEHYEITYIKDYILNKKPNNYQSLHLNLIYDTRLFEIQIRNQYMDDCAKFGSASNYKKTINQ